MSPKSIEKENIRMSPGDLALTRGDISLAIQCFIEKGDTKGLQRVAEEFYRRGEDKKAQRILKKSYEISQTLDK